MAKNTPESPNKTKDKVIASDIIGKISDCSGNTSKKIIM
jgi:hypothetical protein